MSSISSKKVRLDGIDLARALAIVGMVLVHFDQVLSSYPYTGSKWLVWLAAHIEGRSAPTFMILAGIGMSLMGRRAWLSGDAAERAAIRSCLLRRSLVLFIFGLLFLFVWVSDILHYYGLYIAIGSFLLFTRARWLWAGALLLNAGCLLALLAFNSSETWCYDAGWNWDTLEYTGFWTPQGFLRNLLLNGWYPLFPWLGFMLVGIWLGRQNLYSRTVRRRCMLWGGLVAVAAAAASWLFEYHIGPNWLDTPPDLSMALFGLDPLPPTPFYTLQTGATSFFVIAFCLSIAERFGNSRWLRAWFVFGQYSLSMYIGHIVLFISPLIMLDWVGYSINTTFLMGIAATALLLLFCMAWQKRFSRGPFEIVLRRLSQSHRRS